MTALGIQDGQTLRSAPEVTDNLQKGALDQETAIKQGGATWDWSIYFFNCFFTSASGRRCNYTKSK